MTLLTQLKLRPTLKGTQFCPCNCFEDLKCRSNAKVVSLFSVGFLC